MEDVYEVDGGYVDDADERNDLDSEYDDAHDEQWETFVYRPISMLSLIITKFDLIPQSHSYVNAFFFPLQNSTSRPLKFEVVN